MTHLELKGGKHHLHSQCLSLSENNSEHFMLPPPGYSNRFLRRLQAGGPGGEGALTSVGFSHNSEDFRHRRMGADQPGRHRDRKQGRTDGSWIFSFISTQVSFS